ncbi:MAG: gluconate transporter [Roseibacillus sp.]|jgi:Gnt-I system low-affinity gluconate transporter|nr:gluconate transporter [Roseibacillus sp.]MBP36128.1 gluconate transporter [Roseibacillus sp.]MCP4730270.1 gluconate transporter [Roseibacillus sp.]MDP7496291.1 gluconate:H+ symporter [Roseibacillus sp.]HJM63316.1 gluconate:H+ symporter [Roseibacillus sp.]|tara:strand:+ start:2072 stop:3556 length:1485 start_codon:yes stop_codon:yes gene_type:complete
MGLNAFSILAQTTAGAEYDTVRLVSVLALSIVLILVLILVFRIQAFVSLLLASIFVGIASGTMPITEVADTIIEGMGSSLGFIATIIGLGAILGQMIEHSGGAQSLANGMLKAFGEKRANWAMLLTGFVISIPVFLDVGVVILAPIIYALARRSGKSVLVFALPLLAGMAVTHAFVPPTPGPTFVAYALGAPLGHAIMWGIVVGLPTALITLPLCRKLGDAFHIDPPSLEEEKAADDGSVAIPSSTLPLPSLGLILLMLGGPIVLIVVGSIIEANLASSLPEGLSKAEWGAQLVQAKREASGITQLVLFLGHPIVALLCGTCVAMMVLGMARGLRGNALMEVATKALGPAGIIILITGAGGVFKQMLGATNVGKALALALGEFGMGPLLLAWILTTIVRIAQGSATVAMVTGAALIAPVLEGTGIDYSYAQLSLITLAIAAGATGFGHVNDSGFWIVNRYFGMTERETLLTWTPILTAISLVGLSITSLLWLVV